MWIKEYKWYTFFVCSKTCWISRGRFPCFQHQWTRNQTRIWPVWTGCTVWRTYFLCHLCLRLLIHLIHPHVQQIRTQKNFRTKSVSKWVSVINSNWKLFFGKFIYWFYISGLESAEQYKNNGDKKPPFSYSTLICMAMKAKGNKVTLSSIYGWIRENFLYYRNADPSWKVMHSI